MFSVLTDVKSSVGNGCETVELVQLELSWRPLFSQSVSSCEYNLLERNKNKKKKKKEKKEKEKKEKRASPNPQSSLCENSQHCVERSVSVTKQSVLFCDFDFNFRCISVFLLRLFFLVCLLNCNANVKLIAVVDDK